MQIKICHIVSELDYAPFFDALSKFTDKDKYELSFVFLNAETSKMYSKMEERGHQVEQIIYSGRKDLMKVIRQIRKFFKKTQPDIVHTHLVDASLAGLIAARISGINKRVHTRHHSTECHTYYRHGVYYDKIVNRLSKRIMAITTVVKDTLINMENVAPDKVDLINYGYDFADFETDETTIQELKEKYGLTESYPTIGVISRFVEWKGVQYSIPAFAKLAEKYPKAKLVLANAVGNYSQNIKALLDKYLKPSQYVLIEFEPKVFNLYKIFDVFIHSPINRDFEAFGQIYVEPLFVETPSVFTISGIANDFIENEKNALVVPHCDSEAIFQATERLLQDENLRKKITIQGKKDVEELFNVKLLLEKLDKFYAQL